jgi:hypothetical protein
VKPGDDDLRTAALIWFGLFLFLLGLWFWVRFWPR